MKRNGAVLLAGYALIGLILLIFHEPWRDEVQAWLIARSLPVAGIWHEMRYEGHFALWSLLLKVGTSAGWPVVTMQVLSWGLCVLAAWLLIRFAPFRLWEKAVILVSAGMLYWFPVVSRCYALIPPILFALAAVWPVRREHPWPVAVLTVLLTQTHAYMEGMAGMIFVVMVVEGFRTPSGEVRLRWHTAGALGLMVLGALVGFLQVYPAFRCASGASVTPLPDAAAWLARLEKVAVSFADGSCGASHAGWAATGIVWLGWLIPLTALILLWMVSRKAAWLVTGGWLWQFGFAFFLYEYIPQRAALVTLMLITGIWIARSEKTAGTRAAGMLTRAMAAVCLLTVPYGIGCCVVDIRQPYSGVRDAGTFIRRQIPADLPVLLYPYSDRTVAVAAYAPQHGFYAVIGGRPTPFYHRAKNDIASVCFAPEFLMMALEKAALPDEFVLLSNGDYFPSGDAGNEFTGGPFHFTRLYLTDGEPVVADEAFQLYLCRRK